MELWSVDKIFGELPYCLRREKDGKTIFFLSYTDIVSFVKQKKKTIKIIDYTCIGMIEIQCGNLTVYHTENGCNDAYVRRMWE